MHICRIWQFSHKGNQISQKKRKTFEIFLKTRIAKKVCAYTKKKLRVKPERDTNIANNKLKT